MWVNLAAGALSLPTTTLPNADIGQRIALLRAAVTALQQYRDNEIATRPSTRWANAATRPSLVLVAPEYMFVREGFQLSLTTDLKRNRFLEKDDKDRILAELQRISAEHGKQLVLVPGSIASREVLPAPGQDRQERVAMARTHIATAAESMRPLYPGITDDQLENLPTAGKLGGHAAITPKEKLAKLTLAAKSKTTKYYLAENVAYLFNNGKALARYAKHGDFHERLPGASTRTIYVPGIAPGRATVGGINFGVEICLDHGLGTLKATTAVTGEAPRVHLLCSAEVSPDVMNVLVREGGYFVHASSNVNYTVIRRKQGGTWNAPANPLDGVVSGHTMRMGTIELDI